MRKPRPSNQRLSTIEKVTTPLAFLVLSLLIVEGYVVLMATTDPEHIYIFVTIFFSSIFIFCFTVITLAIWRPEALLGYRPLQEFHASKFSSEMFIVLDGSLNNLPAAERDEAWGTFADVIKGSGIRDKTYCDFSEAVSKEITRLANLGRKPMSPGPVKPSTV